MDLSVAIFPFGPKEALVSSALGGWISGMLCDRIGRIRMLQIAILWFAFFTALSGLTNSSNQLLIVRSLQGFVRTQRFAEFNSAHHLDRQR
jgi:nitrate/nitrite transporter NarK